MASLPAVVQLAMELVDSDSEDDEYDEVVARIALKLGRQSRNRVPRYCEDVVTRYLEFEFKRLFRLSRDTLDALVARFEASPFYPSVIGGRPQIIAEKTCLVALSYLGHQCSMYSLADRFDIAESSVQACVDRVLAFLNAVSEEVIAWPNAEEKERCKAGFLAKSSGKGPRNTIGCIDGCHIEINTPRESPHSYFNRKKFPSIILQGICNNRNKFIDVLIGFPGSVHDARVLREGPFFADASDKCSGGYLLGDSAYPLMPWLMTPYKNCERRFPGWKKRYNKHLSQQRVAIENAFGLLKQRFRRLYFVDATSIKQCCLIVIAACVLHNLCNEERDFFDELEDATLDDEVGNDEADVMSADIGSSETLRKFIAQNEC